MKYSTPLGFLLILAIFWVQVSPAHTDLKPTVITRNAQIPVPTILNKFGPE